MLTLYRRHLKQCRVHKTKLPARAQRQFKDCACPIWIYGHTSDGSLWPRQSTKLNDWAEAEALRSSLDAKTKDQQVHGPLLTDCIKDYLASREHELNPRTYKQHVLTLERLETYCKARGKQFIRELTVDLIERFKMEGMPEMADSSKSLRVDQVRCFLREAFRREWIMQQLADKVKTHSFAAEQTQPFSDDEVDTLLLYAGQIEERRWGVYAKSPKTFRLLLEVMLETGMRAGDAVQFDPRRCKRKGKEEDWVYTFEPQKQHKIKRKKNIDAYISDSLKRAIDSCEWLSDKLPFSDRRSDPQQLAALAYCLMKAVGKAAGIEDCRPHRLRDTFAVRMLRVGVPLDSVSRLLGHSSVRVTEMHYAPWVDERRNRLGELVASARRALSAEPCVNS